MKAVRNTAGRIRAVDLDEPAGEGVSIEVASAGICGSDLHMTQFGPMPVTLGHEFAGLAPDGRAFAVDPAVTCGNCPECLRGDVQLCTGERSILGVGADGGMAERVVVPEDSLVPLPANVDVGDAGLVEPLAVAVHGYRLAQIETGMRVGVVGAGTIGLCCVPTGMSVGAKVDLATRYPTRLWPVSGWAPTSVCLGGTTS